MKVREPPSFLPYNMDAKSTILVHSPFLPYNMDVKSTILVHSLWNRNCVACVVGPIDEMGK
jgi:hypothetical protein